MTRRWIAVLLVACWLGQAGRAHAQCCSGPGPATVPGPMDGSIAPKVPLDDLGLPANLPNAFSDANCCKCPQELYIYLGAMALQRQEMGIGAIVLLDPSPAEGDGGNFQDPAVQRFYDVHPNYQFGPRGTIGLRCGPNSVEFSGFHLPQNQAIDVVNAPGQLNTFFVNPPPGFGAGLWLDADFIRTTLNTTLTNAELNCRQVWCDGLELIAGLRYFGLQEKLDLFTADDPALVNQANYHLDGNNQLFLLQLGFEAECPFEICGCVFGAGVGGKGAWGGTWLRQHVELIRGDGLVGFSFTRDGSFFSHLYDTVMFLDICVHDQIRIRLGYEALWVLHVALAANNLNFNLSDRLGTRDFDGSVFYHGPQVELEFLF